MNFQISVKSVWNRIRKIKEKEYSNMCHVTVNNRDTKSRRDMANVFADNVSCNSSSAFSKMHSHLYAKKVKGRVLTFRLKMLKYTAGPFL